jgi:hypothetical protein
VSAATSGYDIVRGSLNQLRSTGGDFSDPLVTETCLANNRTDTYWLHTESPAVGAGVWYLLRHQPGGSFDSGGAGQAGARDAAVGASGNGCP